MNAISAPMRDLLIEHMDGRAVRIVTRTGGRIRLVDAALLRGFLRYNEPTVRRTTVMTEVGRGALACALAEWADALIRAGLDINSPSPDLPAKLALLRKWATSARFLASQESSHI